MVKWVFFHILAIASVLLVGPVLGALLLRLNAAAAKGHHYLLFGGALLTSVIQTAVPLSAVVWLADRQEFLPRLTLFLLASVAAGTKHAEWIAMEEREKTGAELADDSAEVEAQSWSVRFAYVHAVGVIIGIWLPAVVVSADIVPMGHALPPVAALVACLYGVIGLTFGGSAISRGFIGRVGVVGTLASWAVAWPWFLRDMRDY